MEPLVKLSRRKGVIAIWTGMVCETMLSWGKISASLAATETVWVRDAVVPGVRVIVRVV